MAAACGEDEGTGSALTRGANNERTEGMLCRGRRQPTSWTTDSRGKSRSIAYAGVLRPGSFRCRKQWVSGGVIFIGGLARGLFMCSFGDSSSLVTCMRASVEVAGTRIATTRCTPIC